MLDTKLQFEANETNFVLWICQFVATNQLPSVSLSNGPAKKQAEKQ